MITEDYVSFEVAKLLKEKGFEQHKCQHSYDSKGVFKWSDILDPYECSAPTHQMAMKWLREEKYVIIFVLPTKDDVGNFAYCYDIAEWNDDEGVYEMNRMSNIFYTYEQAVETALKYSLENLI